MRDPRDRPPPMRPRRDRSKPEGAPPPARREDRGAASTAAAPLTASEPIALPGDVTPRVVPPAAVPPVAPKAVTPPAVPAKPVVPAPAPVAKAVPAGPAKPLPPPAKAAPRAPKAVARGAAPQGPPPPPPKADPLVGKTLGRCVLEARIGVGRTSVVYRAKHTGLESAVAVKVLLPESVAHPGFVEKFEQEARAIARIDHENILKIYDVFREDGQHGIVMELLEGQTVLDLIEQEERLPPLDAMRIAKQAALGLAAAHAKQIIHRDVKPQNLVVLADGLVKVVDFGLADEAQGAASTRIGTPHYMAPEIWGSRPAEPRSDVYALGITLYHLLVGQPPYAGGSLKQIMAGHVEGAPLYPERKAPGLPKALCDLVRDMTKPDPFARVQMPEVVERIDQIGGEEIRSKAGVRLSLAARRRRAAADARGVPPVAIALAALVVAGIGVAIAVSSGGDDKPQPPPKPASSASEGLEPVGPTRPGVDPAEVKRREDEQRRAAEQAATKADEERRAEGDKGLRDVEAYARESWEDKRGVVRRYRSLAERFAGTAVGDEAKRRADEIAAGRMHPHPDRTVVAKATVEEAARAWEAARPEYEAALAQMRYAEAAALVPAGIEGGEGPLAADIAFHRGIANDLAMLLPAVRRDVAALPESKRTIEVEGRERRIQTIDDNGVVVRLEEGTKAYAWKDLPPQALFDLVDRLYEGRGFAEARRVVLFAFAHRLPDAFFAKLLSLRAGELSKADAADLDAIEARAEARFAK